MNPSNAFLLLSVLSIAFAIELNTTSNRYIVVFQSGISGEQKANHMNQLSGQLLFDFTIEDFSGFVAVLSSEQKDIQANSPQVAYVEADVETFGLQDGGEGDQSDEGDACSTQTNPPWGLDRIDQRTLPVNRRYRYPNTASDVEIFVVDSGIRITHTQFGGRARWGANYIDNINTDCIGHGTHVAGIAGGSTYGVAKRAGLTAVKVLGCNNSGTTAALIRGLQYVAANRNRKRNGAVANVSIGIPVVVRSVNDAVAATVRAGVTVFVAAGNDHVDACTRSPSSAPTAITVGATALVTTAGRQSDARASFSNFGTCVDIFAPGEGILSSYNPSDRATAILSGTSMATPHVSGAAAVYLQSHPRASPAVVTRALVSAATRNAIRLDCGTNAVCQRSPNLLLYSTC
jgi:subtilisin family serine protease